MGMYGPILQANQIITGPVFQWENLRFHDETIYSHLLPRAMIFDSCDPGGKGLVAFGCTERGNVINRPICKGM